MLGCALLHSEKVAVLVSGCDPTRVTMRGHHATADDFEQVRIGKGKTAVTVGTLDRDEDGNVIVSIPVLADELTP